MSIDDATPQEWNKVNRKKDWAWMDEIPNDSAVDSPPHYKQGNMECIDAIRGMLTHDEYIGYLRGNALKYNWRFRHKGKPIEDLRKARWYEERLIRYLLEHPGDK